MVAFARHVFVFVNWHCFIDRKLLRIAYTNPRIIFHRAATAARPLSGNFELHGLGVN